MSQDRSTDRKPARVGAGEARPTAGPADADIALQRRVVIPLALVLLALALVGLVPLAIQRRIDTLRYEILEVIDPARGRVAEVQLATALEMAAVRGYLVTGETRFIGQYQRAEGREQQAHDRLSILARRLDPEVRDELQRLRAQANRSAAQVDRLLDRPPPDTDYRTTLPGVELRFQQILLAVAALEQTLSLEAAERYDAISDSERTGELLIWALAALALGASLLVARLGLSYRRAALRLRASELRLRAVFETAVDGIITVDEHGIMESVNRATERIFGYRADELIGQNVKLLMPEPDRSRHDGYIERYLRTGEAHIIGVGREVLGRRKDGSIFPLDLAVSETWLPGRRIFTGIVRDITERKRVQEERDRLLQREEQARGEAERRAREETALREAAGAVSASFTVTEVIHQIAASAIAACDADGSAVERLDRKDGDLVVEAVAGEVTLEVGARLTYAGSLAQRVIQTGKPELIRDMAAADSNVPPHWLRMCEHCSAAVIPLVEAGEQIGGLLLFRRPDRQPFQQDELERARIFGQLAAFAFRRVHLIEEAERSRDELMRVMESRSRLMRGFSHDVKNPLGAADGFLQLLEEGIMGELREPQREGVGRARRSIRAALTLIEDLLDLARAEAGLIDIECAPVSAREIARDVAEEHRARAGTRRLAMHVELPAELPVIRSDAARIRQILGNLLSNAVKYTQQGSITLRAELRSEGGPHPGQWLVISVSDTGPGIPPEQQQYLFEEFSRLDTGGGKAGAGIGLAISRRLARALGGEITVESEPGRGSTFTLWLPRD